MALSGLLVLALALAFDLALAEPPASVHPVAWMGRLIAWLEARAPKEPGRWQLAYGGLVVAVVVLLFAGAAWVILHVLAQASQLAYILVAALLLKTSFALRELFRAAERVRQPLAGGSLEVARTELRALVSRDTSKLGGRLLTAAAVESVAENTSDSFVAPLLYFVLFGVPGAVAYRAINTLDAMIGYHGKYEYLGKAAARLDDLANWAPARLTALLLVTASALTGNDARRAWRTALQEHGKTESPNAGWPMATIAGALGVQLEKVGHYRLGRASRPLSPAVIREAARIGWVAAGLATILFALGEVLRYVYFG